MPRLSAGLCSASICILFYLVIVQRIIVAQITPNYAQYARISPLRFVQQLSHLPIQQQRLYLTIIGQGLQQRQHLACNPFGGERSCMPLNATSRYAEICGESAMQVDCAYYTGEEVDLQEDPNDALRKAMKDRGVEDLEDACPQCFQNLRRIICAQSVPKCGAFSATIEKAILPAIAAVDGAREDGKTHLESLSYAMPTLLASSSLAMPCREMCEAVVASCSCNNDYSFGKLLNAWLASRKSSSVQPLPRDFAASMFSQLYDKPLCSMFASNAEPGFSGHCYELPGTCSNAKQWCSGDGGQNNGPMVVQELMAGQLATSLFGFAGGLLDDQQEMVDSTTHDDVKDYLVEAGAVRKEDGVSTGLIIVLLVTACILLAGLCAWIWSQKRRLRMMASSREPGGYVSLGAVESNDAAYEPPRSDA